MRALDESGVALADEEPREGPTIVRHYWLFFLSLVGAVGLCVIGGLPLRLADCAGLQLDAQFAGSSPFLGDVDASCKVGDVQSDIAWDFLFIPSYGIALAFFLAFWWGDRTFDSEPGKSRIHWSVPVGAVVAAVVFDALETWGIVAGLGKGERPGEWTLDFAGTVNVLAWFKWVAIGVALLATLAILVTWAVHYVRLVRGRKLEDPDLDPTPWERPQERPELAICCSGGGIRSAAFNLGALSALEETVVDEEAWPGLKNGIREGRKTNALGLLGAADYLASVSGGGYTAAGWRIAASREPASVDQGEPATFGLVASPIIGDPSEDTARLTNYPEDDLDEEGARTELYRIVRRRRQFLRNGAGGLFWSAMLALVMLAWHLGLLLTAVYALSWPLGRLIDSRVVPGVDLGGSDVDIDTWSQLRLPVVWGLGLVGLTLVLRIGTKRGRTRRIFDNAMKGAIGLTAGLAFTLLLVPWLLDVVVPAIEDIPGGNSPIPVILSGSVAATIFGFVRSTLESRLKYLGGVVLAIALAIFALLVMDDATMLDGPGDKEFFTGSWWIYVGVVVGYVILSTLLNPDTWSLQWIYRLRMSQTFSNRFDDGSFAARRSDQQPRLSAYQGAVGPIPLICCAAAREKRTVTGIPAVSFTMDPAEVVVHQWTGNHLDSKKMPTEQYEAEIAWTPHHRRQLGLIGAASLSGAAFAPSMGRISVGTTQAALAALNLRLGIWLPNPRAGKRSRPPLVNMFKEVLGQYDVEAPNLYVTDGGHWENLALVEMVRRQAKVIICIDASGDAQYSHNTLNQAIELAQLECDVKIEIATSELEKLKPAKGERMPERNWAEGEIHYPVEDDEPAKVGRLLYVKAQRSRAMPLQVMRYGSEDVRFPDYSTADQFLTDAEFRNLAVLGRESMVLALRNKRQSVFDTLFTGVPATVSALPEEDAEKAWQDMVNTPFRMKEGRYLDDLYPTSSDGDDA